jgi:hypothetical protein
MLWQERESQNNSDIEREDSESELDDEIESEMDSESECEQNEIETYRNVQKYIEMECEMEFI